MTHSAVIPDTRFTLIKEHIVLGAAVGAIAASTSAVD